MLLARRLQDFVLWGLEALLCFILLDKREREAGRRAYAAGSSRSKPAEPASAYLGHGCLGLFDAGAAGDDPFLNRPALESKAACEALVLGHGALVDDLLGRIRAQGVPAHAVARDIEECLQLIQKDVTPHRLNDLPNQVSRINLVISTSLTHFVDAGVLARLPEDAVILDLAALPGSVNYELAKKFDLKVIWAPPPLGVRLERLDPKVWRDILAILTACRIRRASGSPRPPLTRRARASAIAAKPACGR
jgi:dipicolinate synthase subunit A